MVCLCYFFPFSIFFFKVYKFLYNTFIIDYKHTHKRWQRRGENHHKALMELVMKKKAELKLKYTIIAQSNARRNKAKKRTKKLLDARFKRRVAAAREWTETWHSSQQWVFIHGEITRVFYTYIRKHVRILEFNTQS